MTKKVREHTLQYFKELVDIILRIKLRFKKPKKYVESKKL